MKYYTWFIAFRANLLIYYFSFDDSLQNQMKNTMPTYFPYIFFYTT